MPALTGDNHGLLAELNARCERLDRALDDALTGSVARPAPRKRNKAGPRSLNSEESIKRSAGLVLFALQTALLDDPDGFGALDYYQLKARCKLTDAPFGLALNHLIPSHLRTRDDGDKRYYFLRRELRKKLLMKTRRLLQVA